MKRLNAALLVLGVAFLAYLLWKVGPGELWGHLRQLGWGVVPLILSEGLANLAHTLGWRHCLSSEGRRVSLLRLYRMVTTGWAINYLIPSANVGGEVARASLLASTQGGSQAVSSVLVDKLSTAWAHLLLVALGTLLLLGRVHLPAELWVAMLVTSLLLTAGIVAFLLLQMRGKLGAMVSWLAEHRIGGGVVRKFLPRILQVDEALSRFYRERPWDFVWSVLWHLLGHAMALFQVWLFLTVLRQPVSLAATACAAILGLWFDLLTFAVPLNLGTLEGSRIVALKMAGGDAGLGMAFGVAVRIAQLFWAGAGLVNYALSVSRSEPPAPRAVAPRRAACEARR
jgi:uncharacterized protein (TIRG00374 family)